MMRIIPVIDLLDGEVVHGKSGEREYYEPVESRLSRSSEPLEVANSFQNIGLDELYVADLNAISFEGDNLEVIDKLCSGTGMSIMVDAGFRKVEEVYPYFDSGISRVVLATETIRDFEIFNEVSQIFKIPVTASVDLREGEVISSSTELDLSFKDVIQKFDEFDVSEIILLGLSKVGTSTGPPEEQLIEARELTSLPLIVGGGVRDAGDLLSLKDSGASGALIATSLHDGSISKKDIAQL